MFLRPRLTGSIGWPGPFALRICALSDWDLATERARWSRRLVQLTRRRASRVRTATPESWGSAPRSGAPGPC